MVTGLGQQKRQKIELRIEALINLLDELDGDPDLEDGADDEPDLGGHGHDTDAGWQHDLERDDADDEPSLGRLETIHQGAASYACGVIVDGEINVEDEGEPEDGE
ncbi:hypothetical protein [Aurantimonas sp. 22II-16-19i]|uniref:hypothetical protein n=1 Tax=Aurantimonas sp. 22II-16-19i TaxID=1317114 RepID=UPI0009F7FA9D|nr:hypothetical protein [Aurantimonas sp. 22II-16-19i]ORE88182.1 hypothetical protein ATO4_24277 [Aurantimonas sp. 22II-16-19i]